MLSRLLGLARVMLESRVLGGGAVAGAWLFAFAIPNLFRRLLGEGALGTALVPIITQTETARGQEAMRRDLSVVFAALGVVLALIVVVVAAGALGMLALAERPEWIAAWPLLGTERVKLTLRLLPFLMPYAFFICLTGVVGAVLNTRGKFVLPALGALLLNVFLIAGLALGWRWGHPENPVELLNVLWILVLLAGAVQLFLMLLLLWKSGCFPCFHWDAFRHSRVLGELWHLVLPGLLGASAMQISVVVDRLLALSLGPRAVPSLAYVDRLIDLPIGIFAVSLGQILMVEMSRRAAANDRAGMLEHLIFGLRFSIYLGFPMAAGVIVFREPLLRALLFGGNFRSEDLAAAMPVALWYGAGIPLFCAIKLILPMFHARKQMTVPMVVAVAAIMLNFVLNLILMQFLEQAGIALATVLSSAANNLVLLAILERQDFHLPWRRLGWCALRAMAAITVGGAGGGACLRALQLPAGYGWELTELMIAGGVFGVLYLIVSRLLGSGEFDEILGLFRRRKDEKNG